MKRLSYSASALLGVLLVQVGCSSSVLQLRDQLSLHRGEFHQKLADNQELTTKFLACTRQAHDEPLGERRDGDTSVALLFQQSQEGQVMLWMQAPKIAPGLRPTPGHERVI